MNKVVELDSFQTLEKLFERDYKTDKFMISIIVKDENDEDEYRTHISDNLNARDINYISGILNSIAIDRGM